MLFKTVQTHINNIFTLNTVDKSKAKLGEGALFQEIYLDLIAKKESSNIFLDFVFLNILELSTLILQLNFVSALQNDFF